MYNTRPSKEASTRGAQQSKSAPRSPEGGPPSPTASSHSAQQQQQQQSQQSPVPSVPRWPLKPGVLVHINRTHSMRSGLAISPRLGLVSGASIASDLPSPPLSTSSRLRSAAASSSDSTPLTSSEQQQQYPMRAPVRPFRRAAGKDDPAAGQIRPQRRHRQQRHQASTTQQQQQQQHDEGMLARANRIRAMFSAVQLKESDTFPGISRGKTGEELTRLSHPTARARARVCAATDSAPHLYPFQRPARRGERKREKEGWTGTVKPFSYPLCNVGYANWVVLVMASDVICNYNGNFGEMVIDIVCE